MSRPSTPSKGPRSHREDVLNFLDNLDSYDATPPASKGSAAGAGATSKDSKRTSTVAPKDALASSGGASAAVGQPEDAQSVLDFLDEIVTSRDRRAGTPTSATAGSSLKKSTSGTAAGTAAGASVPRTSSRVSLRDKTKGTESPRGGSYLTPRDPPAPSAPSQPADKADTPSAPAPAAEQASQGGGGWGWGSVWSQASNIVQQARTVAEEQVSKNLSNLPVSPSKASAQGSAALSNASERASQWRTGALSFISSNLNNLDIDKLRKDITSTGMKAFKEVLDAVAPPIAEHEVIQVNLSHDMVGYEGVETLVYRALAKILEQAEAGDLVVNRGQTEDMPSSENPSTIPGRSGEDDDERNLNIVEGFVEGFKLAEANLDALIKKNFKPEESKKENPEPGHGRTSSITVPVTICPVYMRIQPVMAALPFTPAASSTDTKNENEKYLYFILLLRDPTNELVHRTLSQSMPAKWLDIPFEENEWVEDIMVDVIRRGVEILGEEYIKGRMTGRSLKNAAARAEETGETLFDDKADAQSSERESIEVVNASSASSA